MRSPDVASLISKDLKTALRAFPGWSFELRQSDDDTRENVPIWTFFLCKEKGIEISCSPDEVVRSVFLYAGGRDGFSRFPHPVGGIELSWSRERVRHHLGNPSYSRASVELASLDGKWGPLDRNDYANHHIAVEYHQLEPRIGLMVVMSKDKTSPPRPA